MARDVDLPVAGEESIGWQLAVAREPEAKSAAAQPEAMLLVKDAARC